VVLVCVVGVICLCAMVRPSQLTWTPVAVKTFSADLGTTTKIVTGYWRSGQVVGCVPVATSADTPYTTSTVPFGAISTEDASATVTWPSATYTTGTYALLYIPGR